MRGTPVVWRDEVTGETCPSASCPYCNGDACATHKVTQGEFCDCDVSERHYRENRVRWCYNCRDFEDHEHCFGGGCQCPCPGIPRAEQIRREVADLRARADMLEKSLG